MEHFAYCMDREKMVSVLADTINAILAVEEGEVVDLGFPDAHIHLVIFDESEVFSDD